MALNLTVKFDTANLVRGLNDLQRRQVPFAAMTALNKSAQYAQLANRDEMMRVFDRPTPFTLKSTKLEFATKVKLEARVYLKDEGNKGGGSALTRLSPQVFGGQRGFKRMEGALRNAGLLGQSEQAYPGQAAKLDGYGNMSRGEIVQILAWFKAFPETGYRANISDKRKAKLISGTKSQRGLRYFLKRDGRGRGIYRATKLGFGSAIQPVLMFGKRASYKPRLDMGAVVKRAADQRFPQDFQIALANALRTAR